MKICLMRNIFKELKDIKKCLEILGITNNFDITKATKEQYNLFLAIVDTILYNKLSIKCDKTRKIACLLTVESGMVVEINSAFNIKGYIYKSICEEENQEFICSPFVCNIFLDIVDYDNYNFDNMLDSIVENSLPKSYSYLYNSLVLQIIKRYDIRKEIKDLEYAKKLIKIVKDKNIYNDYLHINLLQIKYRLQELDQLDFAWLINKATDERTEVNFKAGCYILLSDKGKFEKQFNLLSKKEQDELANFPIYKLI